MNANKIKKCLKIISVSVIVSLIILSLLFIAIILYFTINYNNHQKKSTELIEKFDFLLVENNLDEYIKFLEITDNQNNLKIYVSRKNNSTDEKVVNSILHLANIIYESNNINKNYVKILWDPKKHSTVFGSGDPSSYMDIFIQFSEKTMVFNISTSCLSPDKYGYIDFSKINLRGCTNIYYYADGYHYKTGFQYNENIVVAYLPISSEDNLEFSSFFPNLQELHLNYNEIDYENVDLTDLLHLEKLTALHISSYAISDYNIDILKQLDVLEKLYITEKMFNNNQKETLQNHFSNYEVIFE